jgi:peptidoglycan/LPS O-acetylase OafA/YrhL
LNGTTLAKDRFYRPDIDGLRAIAILGVVAFHADKRWAPGGFVGVDIFFVISGYLITQLILRGLASGTFSLLEFYQRRIRRIMPALVAVLLATWLIGWIMLAPSEYGSLGEHISAASVFASNFLLIHETGYFDTAAELKPLLHLWSLAVESTAKAFSAFSRRCRELGN